MCFYSFLVTCHPVCDIAPIHWFDYTRFRAWSCWRHSQSIRRSSSFWWGTCCFGKGWGSTKTLSKLFANHNALGQLNNHNTFHFSEGGPSSNPELIESFVLGWGERNCNNVNYVKNKAIFKPQSTSAWSSTPPKQNQDFVKEHNRTPLSSNYKHLISTLRVQCW